MFISIKSSYIKHEPTIIKNCRKILDKSKLDRKVKYIVVGMHAEFKINNSLLFFKTLI